MLIQLTSLNWLGILLAFLAYFILGALWFTFFFSRSYKISLGRDGQILQNTAPIFIIGPGLCALIITITTAILLQVLNLPGTAEALQLGGLIGLGYLVANTVNIAINPNIPRPILYGIITGTYHLIGILLVCYILTSMR